MIYVTRTHKAMFATAAVLLVTISGTLYIRQDKATEISLGEAVEIKAPAAPAAVQEAVEIEPAEISVYICGNVQNPGVVKVKEGTRLDEAMKIVGGAGNEADLTAVNLAYRLSDEDMVYIPAKGEKSGETGVITAGVSTVNKKTKSSPGKLNINTATESELDTLPGVGPATAKAIIQYRNQVRAFSSIEDIKSVKGIGDAKFSSIKDSITVE